MKSQWKNIMYWGFTLVFWLVTFGAWITVPEAVSLNITLLMIGISLVFFKLVWDKKKLIGFARDIKAKSLFNLFVSSFLLVCIWALINYLGMKDLWSLNITQDKRLELSEQTQVLAKSLGEVKVSLITKRERWPFFLPLINKVKKLNKNIDFHAYDLDLKPSLIEKYKLDGIDALVLEDQQKKVVTYFEKNKRGEQVIVNALLRFSQEKPKVITFSQGHGEYSLFDKGNQGLSYLAEKLGEQNFIVNEVDLSKRQIAKETSMLVIWGSKRPMRDEEIEKIKMFLAGGGQLLIAQGPSFGKDHFQKMRDFIKDWDLVLTNTMIIDKLSPTQGMEASIAQIQKFNKSHGVFKNFEGKLYFPLTSPLSVTHAHEKKRAILMAESEVFPASWGEANLNSIKEGVVSFDKDKDIPGPLGVMASSQQTEIPFAGVTVIGSSSFALNNYMAQTAHFKTLLNIISWQLGLDDLILKDREALKREPIILSQKHLYLIFYFAVLLLPLLFFISALYFYLRKRSL